MMQIQFLFWRECPSHEVALARLREVLAEERVAAVVQVVEVLNAVQAQALRFPGSPTIRISDADLFPEPAGPYGLTCRMYHTEDGGVTPLPTKEMIRQALQNTLSGTRTADGRTQTATGCRPKA